jgi:hypothetical protein
MARSKKRYLLVIRLGEKAPSLVRVREAVRGIEAVLDDFSEGEFQLAFASNDASICAYFLKTAAPIRSVRDALTETKSDTGSVLLNGDALLVVEAGETFTGYGFTKASAWLQHH